MLCLASGLSSNYWGLRTKLAYSKHQNSFSSYARGKWAWNWVFRSGWKSGSSFSTSAWFKGELYLDSHRVHSSLAWADTAWERTVLPQMWLRFYKCLRAGWSPPAPMQKESHWNGSIRCTVTLRKAWTWIKGTNYKITYLRLSNLHCCLRITVFERLLRENFSSFLKLQTYYEN